MNPQRQSLLQNLPGVDTVLALWQVSYSNSPIPRPIVVRSIRKALDQLRDTILASDQVPEEIDLSHDAILSLTRKSVEHALKFRLCRVINATGVIVHTNLGRSLLPRQVAEHVAEISQRYSNLEYDLETGQRGIRHKAVEPILCELAGLTGAQAALVVNNNAAAVFLALDTLAHGREVIVSRGELVEIGGSFRMTDIMKKSGAKLVEVGTTNRTHLSDYISNITDKTALLLKVHTSNFAIMGYTAEVSTEELVKVGKQHGIAVMVDLGSGNFVDLAQYGLMKEPTVQDTILAGANLVTFSGDKMLGGPQAGIAIGDKTTIAQLSNNPITRALRIDKMTLAALEAVLYMYRDQRAAIRDIPTLSMLTVSGSDLEGRATRLLAQLQQLPQAVRLRADIIDSVSRVGGGALPNQELPTKRVAVRIEGLSATTIEYLLRHGDPPIIGRIEKNFYSMDVRTIQDDEIDLVANSFRKILREQ